MFIKLMLRARIFVGFPEISVQLLHILAHGDYEKHRLHHRHRSSGFKYRYRQRCSCCHVAVAERRYLLEIRTEIPGEVNFAK